MWEGQQSMAWKIIAIHSIVPVSGRGEPQISPANRPPHSVGCDWTILLCCSIKTTEIMAEEILNYKFNANREPCVNLLVPYAGKFNRGEFQKHYLSTHLRIKSLDFSEIGTSGGNTSVSFQFMTFLYVSCGVSEQKGGYPVEIVLKYNTSELIGTYRLNKWQELVLFHVRLILKFSLALSPKFSACVWHTYYSWKLHNSWKWRERNNGCNYIIIQIIFYLLASHT